MTQVRILCNETIQHVRSLLETVNVLERAEYDSTFEKTKGYLTVNSKFYRIRIQVRPKLDSSGKTNSELNFQLVSFDRFFQIKPCFR